MSAAFGGLVPFYEKFVPEVLGKPDGGAIGRRGAQLIAKKYNLPLIRIGNAVFIDPVLAAERLREAQLNGTEPRRRGRPRKTVATE
jgi:hypothetical protein